MRFNFFFVAQTLYPTELRARGFILNALQSDCSENWGTTGNISESKLNPSPTFSATSLGKLTSGKLTSALTFEYSSVTVFGACQLDWMPVLALYPSAAVDLLCCPT